MQLTNFAIFAILGLASAAPSKRTAAQIESSISTISSNLATLDTQITAFTGSILQAIPLLTAVNNLESSITSGTSTVKSTGALSSADSTTIYSAINTLSSKIISVLSDVEAKASVVASSGYTSIVESALETLKTDADAFLAALEATIDSSLTASLTAIQTTIDAKFNEAISDY
ncbi:hypothetical protein GQ53DRAFT_817239 [Thozetella sp. PMI_491]|nr:hypothetical protein GQ53DRAFT_817239 [Thozetella sp. PMI_491]